jgi:hypothetical protein
VVLKLIVFWMLSSRRSDANRTCKTLIPVQFIVIENKLGHVCGALQRQVQNSVFQHSSAAAPEQYDALPMWFDTAYRCKVEILHAMLAVRDRLM